MKAIIMAGGAGTRLRPISSGRPKPMVNLFDRPVMEYIVRLLKKHNFTDITVTLQYLPEKITEYFGDGGRFGVKMSYSIEDEPLGTAGSVLKSGVQEDGDFLVISGDAVCDMDLSELISFHKEKKAQVTLLLYKSPDPLEYGLVVTDERGKVTRFVEKPGWGQVVTDAVNTGIYVLSPAAMARVPKSGPFDFGRELFPRLLGEGAPIYAMAGRGYWCDVGDAEAYLRCVSDVLEGRADIEIKAAVRSPGLWSDSPLPDDVNIITPCYIGKNVAISRDALVGPCAAIGSGSRIGEQAMVQYAALESATVGKRSLIYSCVLCRDALVGDDVSIDRGSVVGGGAVVGDGASLAEGVRLWPGKKVPAGTRLTSGVSPSETLREAVFDEMGRLSGRSDSDLTPDYCLRLGMAMSGALTGELGICRFGGEAGRACACAFEAGVRACGMAAVTLDADCEPSAAFAARHLGFAGCACFRQSGEELSVSLFGPDGLPLSRGKMRAVEGALKKGEFMRAPASEVGPARCLSGIPGAYAATASAAAFELLGGASSGIRVHVPGKDALSETIRQSLRQVGCRLVSKGAGVLTFAVDERLRLRALDEQERPVSADRLTLLLALLELSLGTPAVAVSADAPSAADRLPSARGRVVRALRDGPEADRLYAAQLYMRDPVFGAARLCAGLMKSGRTLCALDAELPLFFTASREVALSGDRASVMSSLSAGCEGEQKELYDGVRVALPKGEVRIYPHFSRSAIRIVGEGESAEIAEELCALFERRAHRADQSGDGPGCATQSKK